MKIMLIGTSTDHTDANRGNLAGFSHAFSRAFRSLGHEVYSFAHGNIREAARIPGNFDFFLLRDVTVDTKFVAQIAGRSTKFAMFTHAEYVQAATMDAPFFDRLAQFNTLPDHIFYDQPLAYQCYEKLDIHIPGTFLGWGANPACYMAADKDIDIAWFGHAYAPRQDLVKAYIWPLKDLELNVRIHGRDQPDGPVGMMEMFDILARTKIVVRLSHQAHWQGGYSGRTIYDAMASGCVVYHDEFPLCGQMFPQLETCAFFVKPERVGEHAGKEALRWKDRHIREGGTVNYHWVRSRRMCTHVAQQMLEFTFGERPHELFCPY